MHEVFSFMRENLVTSRTSARSSMPPSTGMLSTLDPHSWLLKPDRLQGDEGCRPAAVRRPRVRHLDDRGQAHGPQVLKNTPAYKGGVKKRRRPSPRSTTTRPSAWSCRKRSIRMRGKPGTKSAFMSRTRGPSRGVST